MLTSRFIPSSQVSISDSHHTVWSRFSAQILCVSLVIALLAGGCDTIGSDDDADEAPVTIAFLGELEANTTARATGLRGPLGHDLVFADPDGDSLAIDSVHILVEDVAFQRAAGEDGSDVRLSGPFVANVSLTPSALDAQLETDLPIGRWDALRVTYSAVADSSTRPDGVPAETSVRVTGQWNPADGEAKSFTFTSDVEAEFVIEFDPELAVTGGEAKNITVALSVGRWFRDADGHLIDPNTGLDDGVNEDLVEDNITQYVDGFEDNDLDGKDDAVDDENV